MRDLLLLIFAWFIANQIDALINHVFQQAMIKRAREQFHKDVEKFEAKLAAKYGKDVIKS